MANDYQPAAPDLSRVEERADLKPLIEAMAEKIHDAWAAERMRQGWTHGEKRSDDKKEHPSLVPYQDLPESERELDRVAVRGTLAALFALGYDIARNNVG